MGSGVTRIEGGDASAEADDTEEEKKEKEMKEERDDETALAKARSWDDWKDGEDRSVTASIKHARQCGSSKGSFTIVNIYLLY